MDNCFDKAVEKYKEYNDIKDNEIFELCDSNNMVVGLCHFCGLDFYANVLGQYDFVVCEGCWFDRSDILCFVLKGDYRLRKISENYVFNSNYSFKLNLDKYLVLEEEKSNA